jgi:arylformamidase
MFKRSNLIDITMLFSERLPVWPGDVPVQIRSTTNVSTVSELRMSSHIGTHLDASRHFLSHGRTVEQLPLETLIGPAWLAEVCNVRPVTAVDLDGAGIPQGVERLLLKTMNSAPKPWQPDFTASDAELGGDPFDKNFVALDPSAARWLLDRHIALVGIDGPSIEPYGTSEFPVHFLLLGADVIVVENLRLRDVAPGAYRLICLPLYYEGGDGAPVRAVLETI